MDWLKIAKVGGPLMGGLLSRGGPSQTELDWRSYKMARKLETSRYKWLAQGARAAGFNPASVLGAVGGNFGQVNPLQAASPMSTGQVVGDAIYNFADAMDPVRAETERLNNELLQAEIDAVKTRNQTAPSPLGGLPAVQEAQGAVASGHPFSLRGLAYGTLAKTALGDSVTREAVRGEATAQRETDEGLKQAYGIGGPSWWPTAGYMEEMAGDDGFLTNMHKRLNPLVLGANYLWPEETEGIGHGAKQAFDQWWWGDEQFGPPAPQSPLVAPRPSSRVRKQTRRFN